MNIPMKYEDVVVKLDAALGREAALREELDALKRDAEQDTTIDERDRYHEIADSLALAISRHFRVEIGEHSSMNCPWGVALDVMNGAYVTDTDEARERDALQQRLTVAEQRAECYMALLECVIDTGELTAEKHERLESDICAEVKKFWNRDAALKPSAEQTKNCPNCKVCMGSPDFPENCLINGVKP